MEYRDEDCPRCQIFLTNLLFLDSPLENLLPREDKHGSASVVDHLFAIEERVVIDEIGAEHHHLQPIPQGVAFVAANPNQARQYLVFHQFLCEVSLLLGGEADHV